MTGSTLPPTSPSVPAKKRPPPPASSSSPPASPAKAFVPKGEEAFVMAVGRMRMVGLPLPPTYPPSESAWARPPPASSLGTAENVDYPGAILLKSCTETSRKAFIPFDNMRARAEMHFARFAATVHGTGVVRCTDASFVRMSSETTEGDAVYVHRDGRFTFGMSSKSSPASIAWSAATRNTWPGFCNWFSSRLKIVRSSFA